MNLLETLHDIVKPVGEKPIIQKLIEKAKVKTFDYNAAAIECAVGDRLFIVPYHNSDHLIESYLEYEAGQQSINPNDTESMELMDVVADKEFLEDEFMRNINAAIEL